MEAQKPKVYICYRFGYVDSDMVGLAYAEDGTCIAHGHMCHDEECVKSEMGLTSNRNHDKYQEHYPDGYELEYVSREEIDSDSNPGFEAMYKRWQALNGISGVSK